MKVFTICLLTWLAAGMQATLAPAIALGPVLPSFPVIVLCTFSAWLSPVGSVVAGFFAGLLQGAVGGVSMGAYVISRTVLGLALGRWNELEYEPGPIATGIITAVSTLLVQALMLVLAPPRDLIEFGFATIGSAIYNGVLAIPLFALLAWAFPRSRR
jgi:rod shape-determining protein MreD